MLVAKQKVITVAAAGTPVRLFTTSETQARLIVGCIVQAHTGTLYIGDENVTSTAYGLKLTTSIAPIELPLSGQPFNPQTVYIDGATNGDKLAVLYFEKVSR